MKSIQVVLLAAGKSTRFKPFSDSNKSHKSMFPVCGKPIIEWTLDGLRKIGIKNVLIVVDDNDSEIKNFLKGYKKLNLKIAVQKKALGMGNALLSAVEKLDDNFMLAFPHFVNEKIFLEAIKKPLAKDMIRVLADTTEEPWKYGIIEFKEGKPVGIVEKPEKGKEPSKIRIYGCYLLNKEFVNHLANTPPHEYQFETALSSFMKKGKVEVLMTKLEPLPLKYVWDIFKIKNSVLEKISQYVSKSASIAKTAVIKGKVVVEDGAIISDFAILEGPVYIGKNAVVGSYCILRNNSVLEEGAQIERYTDCARSIVGKNSHIHSGFVGDSIIGEGVRIGANFITANKRLDRSIVRTKIDIEMVSTGIVAMGAVIGNNSKIGINVSTMPGIVVSNDSIIEPGKIIKKNC